MSTEGILEASTHRNNMRLVDHRLVQSQQGNVILECDGVERLVFLFAFYRHLECCRVVLLVNGLALDLMVFVGQPLALVSHVPLSQTDLKQKRSLELSGWRRSRSPS